MAKRLLINVSLAITGALLVARWNGRSGLAVGAAGLFIAIVAAKYEIGAARFLALVLSAIFGTSFPAVGKMAIDATEVQRDRTDEDWLIEWIMEPWSAAPPKLLTSTIIFLISSGLGMAFAKFEYDLAMGGDRGIVLPMDTLPSPLKHQGILLAYFGAVFLSTLFLSIYSSAFRRMFALATVAGGGMGTVIDLSVGSFPRCTLMMASMFLAGVIIWTLLLMGLPRTEEDVSMEKTPMQNPSDSDGISES